MAEPFNVEKFRQQMGSPASAAPQPVPVQMQAAPAAMPPIRPQAYPSPQIPTAMSPQYSPQQLPQQMAPPMPHNPMVQAPIHTQPQTPPMAGQAQAWAPQAQPMAAQPMPAPQMMPPSSYTAPLAPGSAPLEAEAPIKKSLFNLKRLKKEKAPKVKKAVTDKAEGVEASKLSPAMIFMFGMAAGILCCLIGNMIISKIFAG